jgi:hypothetical protein
MSLFGRKTGGAGSARPFSSSDYIAMAGFCSCQIMDASAFTLVIFDGFSRREAVPTPQSKRGAGFRLKAL